MIALRNLPRHRAYTLIYVFGFALGIAACLHIFQYGHLELSYDSFHAKGNQIGHPAAALQRLRQAGAAGLPGHEQLVGKLCLPHSHHQVATGRSGIAGAVTCLVDRRFPGLTGRPQQPRRFAAQPVIQGKRCPTPTVTAAMQKSFGYPTVNLVL